MSKILDGKLLSKQIKDELKFQVDNLIKSGKKAPHLAAIIVGNDGASLTYVSSKVKSCKKIGYNSSLIKLILNLFILSLLRLGFVLTSWPKVFINSPTFSKFVITLLFHYLFT